MKPSTPFSVAILICLTLEIASFLFPPGAHAADAANDSAGPTDPGFSPWTTAQFGIVVGWSSFFLVDNGAWVLPIPFDNPPGSAGFNDAVLGFTGDAGFEYLDVGQTFSTGVLFSPPGIRTATRLPTEGIDFFAQGGGPTPQYQGFGHQVLGIYLTGGFSSVPSLTVVVHTKISDEHPDVAIDIPVGTVVNAPVTISFTQRAHGHWELRLRGGVNRTLTSAEYGTTWNTGSTQGVDAVRYFTSQGTNSSGPLRWTNISVGP